MLVVGEASGDVHGAQLVKALRRRDPALHIFGVAGEKLRQTEFEALFSVSRLTGMGLFELAGNLKNICRAYALLRKALRERRPDLLVLIDFPEFNLRLAKLAKSLGTPVLYYISPQVWAWRRGRVRQIARSVDHMAVVFPFEVPFYQRHGVPVTFVGHPLLDSMEIKQSREAVLDKLGLDPEKTTVTLLPGSRPREIAYHLPAMVAAALRLSRERDVQFICVKASTVASRDIDAALKDAGISVAVVEQDRYDAVNAADLVWTASGTATLETALLLKPMVIVYRLSWLTYGLARLLVRVSHIGMVNLIAGERVVPELIQSDLKPERIVEESRTLLDNQQIRARITEKLAALKARLGSPGAADRVATTALAMIA